MSGARRVTRSRGCGGGRRPQVLGVALGCGLAVAGAAAAQPVTYGGFVQVRGDWYPQTGVLDSTRAIGDLRGRAEVAVRLGRGLRVRGGVDLRVDTYGHVERTWAVDWLDRARRRRVIGVRELNATLARSGLTLDLGKQFIRWGVVDFVHPADRFAPHDYLAVVDEELLAVTGARGAYGGATASLEAVWVPYFTPSRIPLYDKRWTIVPEAARRVPVVDVGARLPHGSQAGVRWRHLAGGVEYALSYYDGYQHLPRLEAALRPGSVAPIELAIARRFPRLRAAGSELAWPLARVTIKGEAAYFRAPHRDTDDYVLYVLQVEHQRGELLLLAGYAGEVVSARRGDTRFAPDRGLAKALLGKAAYTIDPTRRVALEGAVRQSLDGVWLRGEYSQAVGGSGRVTIGAVLIRGAPGDFLGQFRRNAHFSLTWRSSF